MRKAASPRLELHRPNAACKLPRATYRGFTECAARPIRSHGVHRRLTQEEKNRVRKMGEQLFVQRARQTEQNEQDAQRSPRSQDAPPPVPKQSQPQDAGLDARHEPHGLMSSKSDPRLYQNITVSASVFNCGSQGSGKSHTLGCMLENCLIPSGANRLPRPLTGIVFHYDSFTSDAGGAPCEAAYLSSHPNIKVRVLCPPTNIFQIRVSVSGVYSTSTAVGKNI